MKFDHVGVVTPTIEVGRDQARSVLNIERWTDVFTDTGIDVHVQFGLDESGICYELIAPLSGDSPVMQALTSGARILNHVAYLVDDLDREARRLVASRCLAAGPARPAIAYKGANVQFFITPMRFMVELIEAPDHFHDFGTASRSSPGRTA